MAIVNGIVTICKAIINVRQTPHQYRHPQTTNAHLNRALSPSSLFSPTASPAARPAADAERQQPALSRGTFDTRCHSKRSSRPQPTERLESDTTWQAGSAQDHDILFCDTLVRQRHASSILGFCSLGKDDLRGRERQGLALHAATLPTRTRWIHDTLMHALA
jgi:hypothetical protein